MKGKPWGGSVENALQAARERTEAAIAAGARRCPTCMGEGLISPRVVCPQCGAAGFLRPRGMPLLAKDRKP